MRKPTSFELQYQALSRIGSKPIDDEAVSELKRALQSQRSPLVSTAADIAAKYEVRELIPDMISAFEYFTIDGLHVDRQCPAKISIVNALNKLEYMGDEVFLMGAYYVQIEPPFEPVVVDSAVQVRSGCAFGLARTEHPDVMCVLTDLLLDDQPEVRAAAARAVAYLGRPESEFLLRFKVLSADAEPDVMDECFRGLVTMAPDRSIDFVARYLESANAMVAQYAALAIGSSRLPEAYDKLRERWDNNPSPAARRMLLLPIALVRSDESFSFVLDVLRTAEPKTAAEAITALGIYASENEVRKIWKAVKSRADVELQRAFKAEFGNSGP